MFKSLERILLVVLATATAFSPTTALDLTGANWIWTPFGRDVSGSYPGGYATFRKDFTAPAGKTPLSANVVIAADDKYKLYYNREEVGDSNGDSATNADRWCIPMTGDPSVFAVVGENKGGPAGLLAAIQVQYLDGTTDNFVTDGSWRVLEGVPDEAFHAIFDDSTWPAAFVEGGFPSTPPWMAQVSVPPQQAPLMEVAPDPSLGSAFWVRNTNDWQGAFGPRAFRKTVELDDGQEADSLVMDIVADSGYTLYVNGKLVGSGSGATAAQRWHVRFMPAVTIVVAVYVPNGSAATTGLLASGVLQGCACGCGDAFTFQTDDTWVSSNRFPGNFASLDFDDGNWDNVWVQGAYGMAPWGSIPTPTATSSQNGALAGAPPVPTAIVVV